MGLLNPFSAEGYFGRLTGAFGWKFLFFIAFQYGVNQGFAYGWGAQSFGWFFQDKPGAPSYGLGGSPQQYQKLVTAGRLPWQIKAIFGIISDAFAIRNFHRKYYLAFATIFGALGYITLGSLQASADGSVPSGLITLALIGTNLAVAFPDVLVDGIVAQKAQEKPAYAVDLQSLLWSSLAFFGIIRALIAGFIYEALEQGRPMLLAIAPVPLSLGIFALLNWMDDKPDYDSAQKRRDFFKILAQGFWSKPALEVTDVDEVKTGKISKARLTFYTGKLYLLAILLTVTIYSINQLSGDLEDVDEIFMVWGLGSLVIVAALFFFLRVISMDVASTAVYIFLKGAIAPYQSTIDYWSRGGKNFGIQNCCGLETQLAKGDYTFSNVTARGYPAFCYDNAIGESIDAVYDYKGAAETKWGRPCLSESFQSYSGVGSNLVLIVGVIIYNKWLSKMSYRRIWAFSALAAFIIHWFDFIWVKRWNLDIGIPDEVFVLMGGTLIAGVIDRFDSMPFFILAAKLCPPGVEATLFATLMGLSNFGADMGGYLGIVIEQKLGADFPSAKNLDQFYIYAGACKILIFFLIPLLVPNGKPSDPSPYLLEEENDELQETLIASAQTNDKRKSYGRKF